ncbi:MAG: Tad domain-containing protein [Pseudomonadota bacterium]
MPISPSHMTGKCRTPVTKLPLRSAAFLRDEAGGLLVWSLYIMVGILMAVGLGIDTMRTETYRTHLQNTLDRAVLAAADLEQELPPADVVADYFERAGIPADAVNLDPFVSDNERVIGATINANVGTVLLDIIGRPTLPAIANGQAREAINDIEISLVLDNSGSMGWSNDRRLNLLKPAAKDFVDAVMRPGPQGEMTVSMSIVPFSTQVNAGPTLASALSYSAEHSYSHCAEFPDNSYTSVAMDPETELRRGGHFDIFTWNAPVESNGVVCPFDTSRHILPFSQDADALKAQIDGMWAGGNTSIDIAAKWGAALLDPAFRPVVDQLILEEKIAGGVAGRPFDYGRSKTMKVLVVMSDGQNTQEFQLRNPYRSGSSPVWQDEDTKIVSYFDEDRGEYFVFDDADLSSQPGGTWQPEPEGDAVSNLDWPEVWNKWSVAVFARDIKAEAVGGSWNSHYDAVYRATDAGDKNDRASEICAAARDANILVFAIGMDTYGQGDATLEDCAGGEKSLNFFDVSAQDIDVAFASIATQINMLRLTQ